MSELTHTVEALLFVAPEPLSVRELVALTEAPPERVERALDALGDRYGEGRSGVVLEKAAGGWGFRASRETAPACARLLNRPQARGISQAGMETLAIVAYLGRSRGRTSRASAACRPTPASPGCSSAGSSRRRAAPTPSASRCCTGSPPRSRACSGSKRVPPACRASPTSTSPTPITRRCGRGSIWWLISVPERLNRFLASTGLASRRAAEAYIREGRVTVNGAVAELGTRVSAGDDVRLDGEPVTPEQVVVVLLNKPDGLITSVGDPQGRPTVVDAVPSDVRLFPVGGSTVPPPARCS